MLLTSSNIVQYLLNRGFLEEHQEYSVQQLTGGNINHSFLVKTPSKVLIIKQALDHAAASASFPLPRNRLETEYNAMIVMSRNIGYGVPTPYGYDSDNFVLVRAAVPQPFELLTYDLATGVVNVKLAGRLGTFYGTLHRTTFLNKKLKHSFPRTGIFDLKMGVFHRAFIAATNDETIKRNVSEALEKCYKNSICLVHGDTNPKNIFVHGNDFYVIDQEIAHVGDPSFDIGNLLGQYLLACIINYPLRKKYYDAMVAFLSSYEQAISEVDEKELLKTTSLASFYPQIKQNSIQHFGVCLYARSYGPFNVHFIDEKTRTTIYAIAVALSQEKHADLEQIFRVVDKLGAPLSAVRPIRRSVVAASGRLF